MRTDPSPEQVAWAAGLFEGEGCITARGKTSGELVIGMTDLDVLERFQAIMGVGGITVEYRQPPHQDCYRWSVCNAADSTFVLGLLLPWLSSRRRAAAESLLQRMESCRGRNGLKTHCKHGHEYSEENTYITPAGHRRCMACHRNRVNASNLRKNLRKQGFAPVAELIAEVVRDHPELIRAELDG